ncbi:MAG: hypothetical protein KAY37_14925 [Phycisphaerae bacterium]|nr:hypothetical protein [Phycisphaerae bacterium]
MFTRTLALRITLGVVLTGVVLPALAEEEKPERRSFSSMLNVDALIDNYARLLARKYDLTEEQDVFTQEYLRQRTHEFLDQHRDGLFALVDQMFEARGGGEISQEELIDWGKCAMPLFEQAKVLIIEGNNEWRDILTEEQREIHDADLKLMFEGFNTTQEKLHRIVKGEMTVEEFRNPSRPPRRAKEKPISPPPSREGVTPATPEKPEQLPPPRPHSVTNRKSPEETTREEALRKLDEIRRRGGRSAPSPRSTGVDTRSPGPRGRSTGVKGSTDFESEWEKYVRVFIEKYRLNDAQTQKAHSILKECQEQAASHMAKRKSQIEDLDKKIKAHTGDKKKAKELAKLTDLRAKLLEPIGRIFERRLKPSLEKLPTRAQRQAAQKAGRPSGPRSGKTTKSRPRSGRPAPPPKKPDKPTKE